MLDCAHNEFFESFMTLDGNMGLARRFPPGNPNFFSTSPRIVAEIVVQIAVSSCIFLKNG
jgi:hypothetical protein